MQMLPVCLYVVFDAEADDAGADVQVAAPGGDDADADVNANDDVGIGRSMSSDRRVNAVRQTCAWSLTVKLARTSRVVAVCQTCDSKLCVPGLRVGAAR